jgi:hypothetical protein
MDKACFYFHPEQRVETQASRPEVEGFGDRMEEALTFGASFDRAIAFIFKEHE